MLFRRVLWELRDERRQSLSQELPTCSTVADERQCYSQMSFDTSDEVCSLNMILFLLEIRAMPSSRL